MAASLSIQYDLACALDPVLMAERAGLSLDPWQADTVRAPDPQIILNCSRQSGKSTAVAVIIVHTALFFPGSLILILCHALRQAGELFRKAVQIYSALDFLAVPLEVDNKLTLETMTGSRIIQIPDKESNVRSFSGPRLIVIDEAGEASDDGYYAVRPMLAVSQGRIILLGTPKAKRGFFHHEWTEGKDWKKVCITAHDCPRIDPAWLEAERKRVPDWWFRQEYLCQFMDTIDSAFRYEDIQRAISDTSITALF